MSSGDEDVGPIVGYIIGNPVRAGLVSVASAYPFQGSEKFAVAALADYVQSASLPWDR